METKQLLIRSILLLTLFFIGCGDSGRATQSVLPTPDVKYTPGDIITDSQGYISYRVGNTPIIITVPHDGTLTPSTFPDRTGASTRAENTRKIAEQFAYFFNANSNGLYPHIIYNNVSRSKLDPDLNQMDGAQGNSYANCSATFLVFSALAEAPVLSGKVEGSRVPSCGTVIIIGVLPTL